MARHCAYCGQMGLLTAEHVVPQFLYRDYPDHKLGYNEKAKRFLTFEAIVKDVCSTCNSGVLSSLDTYGKQFVHDNGCERTFTKRPILSVRYDHQLLLRWLLKLSYNAVRFAGHAPGLLASCTGFIRGVSPLTLQTALFVEIVRDAVLPEELEYSTPDGSGVTRRLSAGRFRFGEAKVLQGPPLGGQCRLVGLNAFYLYILLLRQDATETARSSLAMLRHMAPQAVQLLSHKRVARVRVSRRTIVDTYLHQAMKDLPAWRRYLRAGDA